MVNQAVQIKDLRGKCLGLNKLENQVQILINHHREGQVLTLNQLLQLKELEAQILKLIKLENQVQMEVNLRLEDQDPKVECLEFHKLVNQVQI